MYLLGYDVGGTKIEAALFAIDGHDPAEVTFPFQDNQGSIREFRLLKALRTPTERQNGYEQIVTKLAELANTLCADVGILPCNLAGIGLGLPGSIHPSNQTMVNGSIFALFGKPLAADLLKSLNVSVPIAMENDANCFALAEVACGAGVAHYEATGKPVHEQIVIGVILGTGCGGGFVVNGRLIRGRHGGGAEIGHCVLYPGGHPCYCGAQGCAEQYVSGTAIEMLFNQRRYSQISSGVADTRTIFAMAERNEPAAIAVIHQYRRDLARFFGKLSTLLDPDYFVLGGGVSVQNVIYEDLPERIAANAFLSKFPVPVYQHKLGDSAGVVGAALLTLN